MRKLVFACLALLGVAAFTAPLAEAIPECYKFVSFCDGLQIDTPNWPNNAQWYHYDCSNNSLLSAGLRQSPVFSDNCPTSPGGARRGLLWSVAPNGPGDWYFVFDAPKDGTIDMHQGVYPLGSCWIDELAYTFTMGNCTGIESQEGLPSSTE